IRAPRYHVRSARSQHSSKLIPSEFRRLNSGSEISESDINSNFVLLKYSDATSAAASTEFNCIAKSNHLIAQEKSVDTSASRVSARLTTSRPKWSAALALELFLIFLSETTCNLFFNTRR